MTIDPIDKTFGAVYVGVVVAGILYGVSFTQTWYYFMKYQRDLWYHKLLVATVLIFETVHQALISHTIYYYTISNYNNPHALENIVWSILLEVLFNGLIGLLAQSFLVLRIWILSDHNVPLTLLSATLVLACFGCSVGKQSIYLATLFFGQLFLIRLVEAFTAQSLELHTWTDLSQLRRLSVTVNLTSVATDLVIAAALSVLLHRCRTGYAHSETMITRLVTLSLSAGILTSTCAIASLVSILAFKGTLIYVAFYFCLGRLYSNSLLTSLNARQIISRISRNSDPFTLALQDVSRFNQRNERPFVSFAFNHEYTIDIESLQEVESNVNRKRSTQQ